ncbi:CLUMA_CG016361, isoform A [Clunio marinus]|uniref:CLUMA_CG016361, isoform A n=1 Tax=Clunio marinus TaxID=568069 RepID=A0A1J1IYA8_9DIPT|nr:CLUMA_CG016361, isoform A [Clunio marinus]
MSQTNKLPKTNSLLPSINYKQFVSLIILLLVTSSTSQTPTAIYECPSGCECNETTFSAKCENLNELITSYSRKQHNFMPIKSLDLSNNQLTKLTNQLELLVNITELNLSHNQLTQVHKLNFEHLETLDLSHNQITSAKLKKLPKRVVHLKLSYNEITYLPVDFMKLKKLRSLELDGNPLNCTCNTLHVRNWITFNHVWSDKHIVCMSPPIVKGRPWLQARQNDICIEPSSTTTQRSKYNWDNYDDENEIMMGDQPQSDVDDVEYEEEAEYEDEEVKDKDSNVFDEDKEVHDEPAPDDDDDESEAKDIFEDASKKPEEKEDEKVEYEDDPQDDDDFMPVSSNSESSSTVEPEIVSGPENEDEGSGFDASAMPLTTEEDDSDESGSGIPIYIPSKDDLESSTEPEEKETIPPLGIFEDNTEAPFGGHRDVLPGKSDASVDEDKSAKISANEIETEKAGTDENFGTYVLIGILGVCLLGLIIFLAMKNRQEEKRNRRMYDVEKSGATELQDMDKRLLGKPIDKNGNGKTEQSPLMNDYPNEPLRNDEQPAPYTTFQTPDVTVEEPKAVQKDNDKLQQQPYVNGNGRIEPVHKAPSNGSIPKLPDSDDETFHPATDSPISPESLNVSPEPPKRYSPVYSPASPRNDRYSPVYSPETGRVKIKLTETPKAKTPVLVTRSRSGAGDYVNTPN